MLVQHTHHGWVSFQYKFPGDPAELCSLRGHPLPHTATSTGSRLRQNPQENVLLVLSKRACGNITNSAQKPPSLDVSAVKCWGTRAPPAPPKERPVPSRPIRHCALDQLRGACTFFTTHFNTAQVEFSKLLSWDSPEITHDKRRI